MTPIELATRRRVTGLTSAEFARLFVTLERKIGGESAHWDADDVESWEIIGPPVTADQHIIDTLGAANEFVATLAKRLYRTITPAKEGTVVTVFPDDETFWADQPDFGGIPHALWNIAALQAIEWVKNESGVICTLDARAPLV
ncbi:hypothetical protein [Bifidobacterium vansinderenii]|uniref:Uncharacterized protein n=1 Tax=Bifidobacterium vansinderenii TaxID=1984871 RepID=A0A229VVW2_9BIFI|nr:hypothetical protein [Bifidobacterium vansinderenii]OXM99675.1 hypothetical protein Tam10B_2098 [Bifidobacterium vansinderenii]